MTVSQSEKGSTPGDYFVCALARLMVGFGLAHSLAAAHKILVTEKVYVSDGTRYMRADPEKALARIRYLLDHHQKLFTQEGDT